MTILGNLIAMVAVMAALALLFFGYNRLKLAENKDQKLRAYLMIAAGVVTFLNLIMFVTAPLPA